MIAGDGIREQVIEKVAEEIVRMIRESGKTTPFFLCPGVGVVDVDIWAFAEARKLLGRSRQVYLLSRDRLASAGVDVRELAVVVRDCSVLYSGR